MNIRKEIDYSTMFAALDLAVSKNLPQMELYCEIGKAICLRTEKRCGGGGCKLPE